jgi:hypothetical protein
MDEDRVGNLKPRAPRELRAEHPEPPRGVGGTVEAPEHPPPRPVPRAVKLAAGGLVVFLVLSGAIWVMAELGWRRVLALIGCGLVFAGLQFLRFARPSDDFLEGVRKLQRGEGGRVTPLDELRRVQTKLRLFGGGVLLALGAEAIAVAIWA